MRGELGYAKLYFPLRACGKVTFEVDVTANQAGKPRGVMEKYPDIVRRKNCSIFVVL